MTSGFRIRNAHIGLKVVLTVFDLFFAMGLVTSFYIARSKMRLAGVSVAEYYRGDAEGYGYAISALELLETTHLHAFSMGLIYMVLAHVFLLTDLGPNVKVWAVGIWGFLFLGKLLLPWIIRYGPEWSEGLFGPVSAAFGILCLWILVQPLWEMWGPKGVRD